MKTPGKPLLNGDFVPRDPLEESFVTGEPVAVDPELADAMLAELSPVEELEEHAS